MKSRFLANLCLTLLLLFAQHVALADVYAHQAKHAISDQTTQSALEDGSASSNNGDTGNHFSLDDLDSGLTSTFVLPTFTDTARFVAYPPFSDYFTVFLQFYSPRAPPAV
jgi:hypothetical protein